PTELRPSQIQIPLQITSKKVQYARCQIGNRSLDLQCLDNVTTRFPTKSATDDRSLRNFPIRPLPKSQQCRDGHCRTAMTRFYHHLFRHQEFTTALLMASGML
ncbi:MAG: hypothetical protein WCO71_07160, partial [Pseudomonadota bacterium]